MKLSNLYLPNLYLLLKATAKNYPNAGIIFYLPGKTEKVGKELKYRELLKRAQENAHYIHELGLEPGSIILLHFKNHVDNVEWFWSVICAGYVPAMSTPFTNNIEQRKKHIEHLHSVLQDPLCLTREELLPEFESQNVLRLHTIDNIPPVDVNFNGFTLKHGLSSPVDQGSFKTPESLAALMLTSGSSGHAKAVCLTHTQMLHSIASKSKEYGTGKAPLFNWIGFDHVACITEIHMQAMWNGADQVMIQAEDLVPNPMLLLELTSKHRTAATFAPNFFLGALYRALEHGVFAKSIKELDLSCLKAIVSGGEANVVETCVALTKLLGQYGVREDVLKPTFGMTETCAGVIYSRDCPRRDVECGNEFAAVGSCIEGIEMRMTDNDGNEVGQNAVGNLEVCGPLVFSSYYNNPKSTKESFNGKWFMTGDRGFIDSAGHLHLTGRSKETIIINGVNYFPFEIEATLENIPGTKSSYTVVFPYRTKSAQTESLCVVYLPTYSRDDIDTLVATNDSISKTVVMQTGVRPYIIPLDNVRLHKSTLGKLSRAKVRASFEEGEFKELQEFHDSALTRFREATIENPANATEKLILKAFENVFDVPENQIGVKSNIFSLGINSIDLIKLKQRLQREMNINNIPMITIMTNSSVRELATQLEVLQKPQKPRPYNPMVVLQSKGSKAPLWLIHPGVGEILVFFKLASYFEDRPVYALRARGFEIGEKPFNAVEDVVKSYYTKIKESQPAGPYAIAGYSYGSMIAFEITKLLLQNKDEVKFLGIFNLPPHIKYRMRQLDWTSCILQLSYFLEFFPEEYAHSHHAELEKLSKEEVLQHIVDAAPPERMIEVDLDKAKLANWVDVAYSMQYAAVDYEPSGMVDSMDVFVAIPLAEVAKDMNDWKTNHLSKWADFSKTAPRFHEVDGAHYTMIGPDNVYSFQRRLKAVLQYRNI